MANPKRGSTYKETVEMAMLMVKRNENATRTRFSRKPSEVSLKWPVAKRT